MAVTDSEKDYSCSTCGHYEPTGQHCQAMSKADMNPQMSAGIAAFTFIATADSLFRWCGKWKRIGSLNNPVT